MRFYKTTILLFLQARHNFQKYLTQLVHSYNSYEFALTKHDIGQKFEDSLAQSEVLQDSRLYKE